MDYVDLYCQHRVDTLVPIEYTIRVKHFLGISNCISSGFLLDRVLGYHFQW